MRISKDELKEMNASDLSAIRNCADLQQGDRVNVIQIYDKGKKRIRKAIVLKRYNTYVLIKYINTGILESFLYIDIYMDKYLQKV